MYTFLAFLAGLVFSVGLAIAGMTQPQKIVDFLNLAGDWDPSLAFVMVGAILVYAPGLRLVLRRKDPILGGRFQLPTRRDLTPSLVGGAALFGVGWALAGFCPGPAIASVVTTTPKVLVFVGAMTAGMVGFNLWERHRAQRTQRSPAGALS